MMKKYFIALGVFFVVSVALGQSRLKIGDNPYMISSPSAVFELESGTRGFLPPRMTQASMTAITPTAIGLTVYCTSCTQTGLYVYTNTSASGGINGWFPATVYDAATNTKGLIQLAGDLTNTAASPTIASTTVTNKALTGFSASSATGAITDTDTILSAFRKIEGNKSTSITSVTNTTASYPTVQAVKDYLAAGAESGSTFASIYPAIVATTTAGAQTIMTFTLPSAGKWEINATVGSSLNAASGLFWTIYDSTGNYVTSEIASSQWVGGTSFQGSGSASFIRTTSASETYTLRVWKVSGGTSVYPDNNKTWLTYKKISGFLPVTYNLSNITVNKSSTGLIPPLTGYSGTSNGVTYTASASSEHSMGTYQAWKCMQATNADWATNSVTSNFWIQVQLSQPKRIWKVAIQGRLTDENPTLFIVQGSTDGSTWHPISSLVPLNIGKTTLYEIATDYFVPYSYIRLYCYTGVGAANNPGLQRFQIYEAN